MNSKILWLPSYRGLNEMINRKHNIKTRIKEDDNYRLIFFTGTSLEENMFDELLSVFIEGKPEPRKIFDEIKKHYQRVVKGLSPDDDELLTHINDYLVEIDWLLDDGPQDSEEKIRDIMQTIQLLMGSRIATSLLKLDDWSWVDARDLFWVEEDYHRTGPSDEKVKSDLRNLVTEKKSILPVITQGNLVGTDDNNSLFIDLEDPMKKAAKELDIDFVEL